VPHLRPVVIVTAGLLVIAAALFAPAAQAPPASDCAPPAAFAVVHPMPAPILRELELYIEWRQIDLLRPLEYVETRQRGTTLVFAVRAIGTSPAGWETITIDIGFGDDGTVRCCIEK